MKKVFFVLLMMGVMALQAQSVLFLKKVNTRYM